jgi:hypothetical protein
VSTGTKVVLAALGAVVLIGLATGGILLARDDAPPTDYDDRIEDDFMATCTDDAEALGFAHPDEYCRCAYEAITIAVPFDRFLEIDAALQADPTSVPRSIQRIRTRCYLQVEA